DPVGEGLALRGRRRADVEPDRAVDRALLDGIAAELPVLGVHPGARELPALFPAGPRPEAELRPRSPAEQEVSVVLVGDDGAVPGVVEDGVPDVASVDEPVVVEEDPGDTPAARALQ